MVEKDTVENELKDIIDAINEMQRKSMAFKQAANSKMVDVNLVESYGDCVHKAADAIRRLVDHTGLREGLAVNFGALQLARVHAKTMENRAQHAAERALKYARLAREYRKTIDLLVPMAGLCSFVIDQFVRPSLGAMETSYGFESDGTWNTKWPDSELDYEADPEDEEGS
jgi:hypothetical protein